MMLKNCSFVCDSCYLVVGYVGSSSAVLRNTSIILQFGKI